jgi:serine/threonine protein kinase
MKRTRLKFNRNSRKSLKLLKRMKPLNSVKGGRISRKSFKVKRKSLKRLKRLNSVKRLNGGGKTMNKYIKRNSLKKRLKGGADYILRSNMGTVSSVDYEVLDAPPSAHPPPRPTVVGVGDWSHKSRGVWNYKTCMTKIPQIDPKKCETKYIRQNVVSVVLNKSHLKSQVQGRWMHVPNHKLINDDNIILTLYSINKHIYNEFKVATYPDNPHDYFIILYKSGEIVSPANLIDWITKIKANIYDKKITIEMNMMKINDYNVLTNELVTWTNEPTGIVNSVINLSNDANKDNNNTFIKDLLLLKKISEDLLGLLPIIFNIPILKRTEITIGEFLAKGAFGQVFAATYNEDQIVVKTIELPKKHSNVATINSIKKHITDALTESINEATIMTQFSEDNPVDNPGSDNLVKLIGIVSEEFSLENPLLLAIEHCSHGSLLGLLEKKNDEYYKEDFILNNNSPDFTNNSNINIAMDIVKGMEYLHSKNIIHLDIAARNILVNLKDNKVTCKVADFGLSIFCDSYGDTTFTSAGMRVPIKWTSREIYEDYSITNKSDIWSFGGLLIELLTNGTKPWTYTYKKYKSKDKKLLNNPYMKKITQSLNNEKTMIDDKVLKDQRVEILDSNNTNTPLHIPQYIEEALKFMIKDITNSFKGRFFNKRTYNDDSDFLLKLIRNCWIYYKGIDKNLIPSFKDINGYINGYINVYTTRNAPNLSKNDMKKAKKTAIKKMDDMFIELTARHAQQQQQQQPQPQQPHAQPQQPQQQPQAQQQPQPQKGTRDGYEAVAPVTFADVAEEEFVGFGGTVTGFESLYRKEVAPVEPVAPLEVRTKEDEYPGFGDEEFGGFGDEEFGDEGLSPPLPERDAFYHAQLSNSTTGLPLTDFSEI